ncbi:hypothetical protein [Geomicrobium sediminis]|uniref:Uncharacterized protein n=1 Tax=Geomicrobium sediminis TaxID=1347788 RepID=A0ABS2PBK6_9BACL|nr:hypothetical protein [Geomicrobium sediminis]MBM7632797.1 hypothetical protein [Geomicrobium sediminis]
MIVMIKLLVAVIFFVTYPKAEIVIVDLKERSVEEIDFTDYFPEETLYATYEFEDNHMKERTMTSVNSNQLAVNQSINGVHVSEEVYEIDRTFVRGVRYTEYKPKGESFIILDHHQWDDAAYSYRVRPATYRLEIREIAYDNCIAVDQYAYEELVGETFYCEDIGEVYRKAQLIEDEPVFESTLIHFENERKTSG